MPRTPAKRSETAPARPAGGSLADGLVGFVAHVEGEVAAVENLSARIDELVTELNAARDEQASRLLNLDGLRDAVQIDPSLVAYVDATVQPQMPVVDEIVPARLQ